MPTGPVGQSEFIERLTAIVGKHHVLTQHEDVVAYTVDWTGRYQGTGRIVVRPGSTTEVTEIVRLCIDESVAIVPQGGNTGLVGGSVPLRGEVVLSTKRLASVGNVDGVARQITVGAGATLASVQQAAHRSGLHYPVDFGSRDSATIGGSVATNAGGISVLRYGMTRHHVVGIEAVLGTGEVVSHLGGLVKDNTGYDLAGLLCGSEGTLGVITAVRLQLVPRHEYRTTALIGFGSIEAAMSAVGTLCSSRDDLDAVEIMFDSGVRLVEEVFDRRVPFSAPVYLLVEISSDRDFTESGFGSIESLSDVVNVAVATSEAQRDALWKFREEHTLAINSLGPPLKFDVTVPLREIPAFTMSVQQAVSAVVSDATTFLFGHAADGNLHVNISGVDADSSMVPVIEDSVMAEVVRYEGSVSAEHGIGTVKKRFLKLSRSRSEIETMRAIKSALDPDGIMNPNALFD
jgi:glycolate oxidase subunit GlcD